MENQFEGHKFLFKFFFTSRNFALALFFHELTGNETFTVKLVLKYREHKCTVVPCLLF